MIAIGLFIFVSVFGDGAMQIIRAYNNNLVLSKNKKGQEVILKGLGIGFQKKKGDSVDETLIEKIFILENSNAGTRQYLDLLNSIPTVFLSIADTILEFAGEKYNIKTRDLTLLTLSDHLKGAVDRYKQGMLVPNALNWEIQRMYRNEYRVGLYGVAVLNKHLHLTLPEDEAGYIAMHLINGEKVTQNDEFSFVNELTEKIIAIVEQQMGIPYDPENFYCQRFQAHLQFLAKKIHTRELVTAKNITMFDTYKRQYPQTFSCVHKIFIMILNDYNYELNKEEMFYLMLHTQNIYEQCNSLKS